MSAIFASSVLEFADHYPCYSACKLARMPPVEPAPKEVYPALDLGQRIRDLINGLNTI